MQEVYNITLVLIFDTAYCRHLYMDVYLGNEHLLNNSEVSQLRQLRKNHPKVKLASSQMEIGER
jgi:hypothetical protein